MDNANDWPCGRIALVVRQLHPAHPIRLDVAEHSKIPLVKCRHREMLRSNGAMGARRM